MHEVRFIDGLVRKIEDIAAESSAKRVREVKVHMGPLVEMTPDHFRKHFKWACRGTIAEDARLSIRLSERIDDPLGQDVLLESVTLDE